ncbi:MAG: pore-forming ESAT-6 family protein [Oscillospiraceae bacterium]|jgi:WXG100 family type VII secretion target|nr:pore-forming ESAT-6 family protein [Oscillospiraceae bacterium]
MSDIRISFEEVKEKANRIRALNDALTQTLHHIKTTVHGLESQWTSDASDVLRVKITAMQPRFDAHRDVIESYARFLEGAVSQYATLERTISSNAGQFL